MSQQVENTEKSSIVPKQDESDYVYMLQGRGWSAEMQNRFMLWLKDTFPQTKFFGPNHFNNVADQFLKQDKLS